ncbi:MAG: hypothetical protein RIR76_2292 [Verrucomicrobiota bacterium]
MPRGTGFPARGFEPISTKRGCAPRRARARLGVGSASEPLRFARSENLGPGAWMKLSSATKLTIARATA